MKKILITLIVVTIISASFNNENAMEESNLEQSVVYYSRSGKTHSSIVEVRTLNAEIMGENIKLNAARYIKLSEWSISSPEISWFGGRSMAYVEIRGKVYGFTIWGDVLYVTPSIPGSVDVPRDEIPKLRAAAENQTTLYKLNLPHRFRRPGYASFGVDYSLRIDGIEIHDNKIVVTLENRLKSKIPVTINVPEMTLGEVGEEF